MATPGQCNRHALHLPCHDAPCSQIKLVGKICGRGFRQSRPSRTEPVRESPWFVGTGHGPFDFSQCFYQPGSDCGHSVRTCPLHSSIPEGGPGRSWPNQATSAMAALSAISDRVAKAERREKNHACNIPTTCCCDCARSGGGDSCASRHSGSQMGMAWWRL